MADTMENGFKKVLIVCNYNKEGAGRIAMDMEKYLMEKFGNCHVIAKESGYWIMKSVK